MSVPLVAELAPTDVRDRAKRAAQWFNASETWIPLALTLREVRNRKAYRVWNFSSFSVYVEDELDLPKSVSSELLRRPRVRSRERIPISPTPHYSQG